MVFDNFDLACVDVIIQDKTKQGIKKVDSLLGKIPWLMTMWRTDIVTYRLNYIGSPILKKHEKNPAEESGADLNYDGIFKPVCFLNLVAEVSLAARQLNNREKVKLSLANPDLYIQGDFYCCDRYWVSGEAYRF